MLQYNLSKYIFLTWNVLLKEVELFNDVMTLLAGVAGDALDLEELVDLEGECRSRSQQLRLHDWESANAVAAHSTALGRGLVLVGGGGGLNDVISDVSVIDDTDVIVVIRGSFSSADQVARADGAAVVVLG